MLVSEGGKAMQSGENVLSAIRHDGTGNYAANLARQGWDALGKGMHNVGHSLKNSGRAWNRFVSGWQDAKQAANAAHSNPNNTVMRDFWDGQFKRFGDWSKGHGWSIGDNYECPNRVYRFSGYPRHEEYRGCRRPSDGVGHHEFWSACCVVCQRDV